MTLSPIAQPATKKTPHSFKPLFAALAACALCFATASQAAPITGEQQINAFGWVPGSTNALNFASQAPGHIGQASPYVLFNTNAIGSVTLDFFNLAPGLAFFETRIDDIATGANAHPVVVGDTIHTGGTAVLTGTSVLGKTFLANNYVDIRLALGGERDWDFDWVRFEVQSANAVPLPGTLPLVGLALFGLVALRRRS
jgi:hypothetical protein